MNNDGIKSTNGSLTQFLGPDGINSSILPFKVVTPFSPTSIANLALWLDANDFSTLTLDGSNGASQWNDKSGNANHATQSSSSARPIYNATGLNSLPALTQTGSPQHMVLTNHINVLNSTMFAVCAIADATGARSILGSTAGGNFLIGGSAGNVPTGGEFYDTSGTCDFNMSGVLNHPLVFSGIMGSSPAAAVPYKNGVAQTVTSTSGIWTSFYNNIGVRASTLWFVGPYSEIIIYSANLSNTDFTTVSNYLISKWSIT